MLWQHAGSLARTEQLWSPQIPGCRFWIHTKKDQLARGELGERAGGQRTGRPAQQHATWHGHPPTARYSHQGSCATAPRHSAWVGATASAHSRSAAWRPITAAGAAGCRRLPINVGRPPSRSRICRDGMPMLPQHSQRAAVRSAADSGRLDLHEVLSWDQFCGWIKCTIPEFHAVLIWFPTSSGAEIFGHLRLSPRKRLCTILVRGQRRHGLALTG